MPPPVRTIPTDYHYHIYDYGGSAAWQLSPPVVPAGNLSFYSMHQDLNGLVITGNANGVPNIACNALGGAFAGDGVMRTIDVLSFGGPNPIGATPQVVITGGIHAREWVASEMAYLLAEYLVRNYTTAVAVPHPTRYQLALRNLVDSRHIHIIPLLNPHGNAHTITGGVRLWRKNRNPLPTTGAGWLAAINHLPFQNAQNAGGCTYDVPDYDPLNNIPPGGPAHFRNRALQTYETGVDLNRNFNTQAWGYDCGPNFRNWNPTWDSFFGANAASETETQQVQLFLANTVNVETAIDYHSYSKLILYPSEAFNLNMVGANYEDLGWIMQRLIRAAWSRFTAGPTDYALNSPRLSVIGYDATGSVCDRIAQMPGGVRAFTIELDPAFGTAGGFVLPETAIQGVFEKNVRAALALIEAAGQQSNINVSCCFGRRTIASGEREYLRWNVFGQGNQLP